MFTSTVLISSSSRTAMPVRPILHVPAGRVHVRAAQPARRVTRPVREIDVRQRAAHVLAVTWQHWQP